MSVRKNRTLYSEAGPWVVPGINMDRVPPDVAFPIAVLLAARWAASGRSLTEDESANMTHAAIVCADRLGLVAWPVPEDKVVEAVQKVMVAASALVEPRMTSPPGAVSGANL